MATVLKFSTPEERKAITLEELIQYCVDTKNVEALKWLKEEDSKRVSKKLPSGSEVMVKRNFNHVKTDFLKQFCGYKTKSEMNATEKRKQKQAEAQRAIDDLFARAFEAFE